MLNHQARLTATRRGVRFQGVATGNPLAPSSSPARGEGSKRRGRRDRQGIVLLVVMAMLALFSVIVLTFVIVARQHKQSADAALRNKSYDDGYEDQLNQAALQILRGTTNPLSVMGPHSLFEDMYGDGKLNTTLTAAASYVTNSNQNLVQLSISGGSTYSNYYNGQVLTMLEGDAKLLSTRIVAYSYNSVSSTGTLWVMPFENGTLPKDGEKLLINGRAFSGLGFGYDSTFNPNSPTGTPAGNYGLVNAADSTLSVGGSNAEYALLPNPVYFKKSATYTDPAGGGGANEGYDVPDHNDMLLAARYWNSASSRWEVALPSLHRPDLIRYWKTRGLTNNDMRRVILRPLPSDHPKFTGSSSNNNWTNPNFNTAAAGQPEVLDSTEMIWDVDNDGDGVADSVWVDLGFPVQTARDGKQYKPLFAVLCIDLDGRLNVNAHGSVAHLSQPTTQLSDPRMPNPGSATLPFGEGHGVAEVYLKQAFPTDYQNLLQGNSGIYEEGRFGELAQATPRPGENGKEDFWAGIKTSDEFWNAIRTAATDPTSFGSPPDFNGDGRLFLDQRGQPIFVNMGEFNFKETIDDAYEVDLSRKGLQQLVVGSKLRHRDNPFMPSDLEPILRRYDIDYSALPNRLAALSPNDLYPTSMTAQASLRQGIVTTNSADLPSPSIVANLEQQQLLKNPSAGTGIAPTKLSVIDLWRARMVKGGFSGNLNTEMAKQLPPELLAGLRMDLNRPFGNGRDDNGNNIVDEPYEYIWNDNDMSGTLNAGDDYERVWAKTADTTTNFNTFINSYKEVPTDLNGDGKMDDWDSLARWQFAKNLYVMAMTLQNSGYNLVTTEAGVDKKEATARRLAQWAINVVDFRDSDLIMTPFEYDVDPFNGWDVDGFIGANPGPDGILGNADDGTSDDDVTMNADRRLVWGCEEPVLLLTETKAFHDRRVEDLANDDNADPTKRGKTTDPDPTNAGQPKDADFDQRRIPQGTTLIELYCTTRNRNDNPENDTSNPDPILVSRDLFNANGQLDLGLKSGDDPVWRLAITSKYDIATEITAHPDSLSFNPDPNSTNFSMLLGTTPSITPPTIERIVWFTNTGPGAMHADVNKVYWNRDAAATATNVTLDPGQYAVVGPYRKDQGGNAVGTKISKGPGGTNLETITVQHNNVTVTNGASAYPSQVQARRGIPVGADKAGWNLGGANDVPIPFSISEPLFSNNYYPMPNDPTPTTEDGVTVIDKYLDASGNVFDQPLDDTRLDNDGPNQILKTGTTADYKTVFLQRLANPLLPFDATSNPYISVDWMPIDLTVYNGQSNPPVDNPADPLDGADPKDPDRGTTVAKKVSFGTRQRGKPRTPAGSVNTAIWKAESEQLTGTNVAVDYFGNVAKLDHTIGYINLPYQDPSAAMGTNPWFDPDPANLQSPYDGSPSKPFSWLTWSNRPFASNLELLFVPASSPSRLTYEYTQNGAADPYPAGGTGPYGHLLNFFESGDVTTVGSANPPPEYHKVFEYLTVPSRFAGTEDFLDPGTFKAQSGSTNLAGFYAPFNRVSRFSDPGRININTIFDDGTTWAAILNNMQSLDTTWASSILEGKILKSRKGYGNNTSLWEFGQELGPDMMAGTADDLPGSPSFFANPFQSFGASYNVPVESLRRQNASASGTRRSFVETSLLRPDPDTSSRPLFAFNSTNDYNSTDNNPYFRYQALQKLGNVVTTRSNVYAIWITVGFFEVTPATDLVVHPDGYELGAEIGSDDGNIARHRMFMMVDRSIPVAFERGKSHNVHKAILLKRVIE